MIPRLKGKKEISKEVKKMLCIGWAQWRTPIYNPSQLGSRDWEDQSSRAATTKRS
jgi:hypothetical protein